MTGSLEKKRILNLICLLAREMMSLIMNLNGN